MKNLSSNFEGWPTGNYGPPAVTDIENTYTDDQWRGADHTEHSDSPILKVDNGAYIMRYMHDLRYYKSSPCPFLTASPDVCGEAASLPIGA